MPRSTRPGKSYANSTAAKLRCTRRVSAFDQTYPHRWMVAHTALIYSVATLLWGLIGLAALPIWLASVVNIAFMWLAFMLSISFMTELYRMTDPTKAPPQEPIRVSL